MCAQCYYIFQKKRIKAFTFNKRLRIYTLMYYIYIQYINMLKAAVSSLQLLCKRLLCKQL